MQTDQTLPLNLMPCQCPLEMIQTRLGCRLTRGDNFITKEDGIDMDSGYTHYEDQMIEIRVF